MERLNYGDINKFLVSIGIILIVLSVLTPYLYLKEDFGLYFEKEKIEKFQEPIKELISNKQSQVIKIQKLIPYISLILLVTGLIIFGIGLRRWYKRQLKLDKKFDLEVKKLDLEIVSLTPAEKEEKAKQEIEEIEGKKQSNTLTQEVKGANQIEYIQNYIQIEKEITSLFESYNSRNFDILSQQRIGKRFEIDIILKAKNKRFLDRVVEIKYFKNKLSSKIIKDTIYRINTLISFYKEASNRKIVPVLLIVYNKSKTSASDILKFQNSLIDESQDIPNLNRLKVEFIEETEIIKFDVRRIIKK